MGLVTQEISNALEELSIEESSFQLLPSNEASTLLNDLLDKFVTGGDCRWWWERFSLPHYSIQLDYQTAFKSITDIVPSPQVPAWFVVEEVRLRFYPIYEASPADIQKVIGECYGFEYYIVSKSMAWLLCENHHSYMIGIGDDVIYNMKELNI